MALRLVCDSGSTGKGRQKYILDFSNTKHLEICLVITPAAQMSSFPQQSHHSVRILQLCELGGWWKLSCLLSIYLSPSGPPYFKVEVDCRATNLLIYFFCILNYAAALSSMFVQVWSIDHLHQNDWLRHLFEMQSPRYHVSPNESTSSWVELRDLHFNKIPGQTRVWDSLF